MSLIDYTFSEDELLDMRRTQTGHMLDQCVVMQFTAGASNEYNEDDAPTYPDLVTVECGLDMNPGSRPFGEEMTVIRYDAVIRLPLHTPVTEKDHIRMVARFGEAHDPLIYEIISPIDRGLSSIRLYLRKVVT